MGHLPPRTELSRGPELAHALRLEPGGLPRGGDCDGAAEKRGDVLHTGHAETSVVVPRSSIIVLPASLGDGVGVAGVEQNTCGITQTVSCFPGNTVQFIMVFVNLEWLLVCVDIMQLDIVRSAVVGAGLC